MGKGDYVIFCPPEFPLFDETRKRGYISAGFCPGNYGFMMKRVLAVAGETILSTGQGLSVNGVLLTASVPLEADSVGRAMPRYRFAACTLRESELLLMSDVSSTSFDERYFGPVHLSQVRGVITPIITF